MKIAQHSAYVNPRSVSILLVGGVVAVFTPVPSIARKLPLVGFDLCRPGAKALDSFDGEYWWIKEARAA